MCWNGRGNHGWWRRWDWCGLDTLINHSGVHVPQLVFDHVNLGDFVLKLALPVVGTVGEHPTVGVGNTGIRTLHQSTIKGRNSIVSGLDALGDIKVSE